VAALLLNSPLRRATESPREGPQKAGRASPLLAAALRPLATEAVKAAEGPEKTFRICLLLPAERSMAAERLLTV
jgi:hypothetical protein